MHAALVRDVAKIQQIEPSDRCSGDAARMMDVGLLPGGQKRYGYFLGPIGAYLDLLVARNATIAEIEDGFFWHCYKRDAPLKPVTGVFAFSEVKDLIESITRSKETIARNKEAERLSRRSGWLFRRHDNEPKEEPPHPLFPLGYEVTLRAMGSKLEDQRAYCPLLAEREESLLVIYSLPLPNYIKLDVSKMETFTGQHEVEYSRDDLAEIIDMYGNRRGGSRSLG